MPGPIIQNAFAYQVGPVQITGFGIAVLIAFLIAQIITERELVRREHDARQVGALIFAAVVGTFVGAKLYYVLIITHNWHDMFSRGGFVYWGGFIGAVVAVAWVIHRKRLPFLQIADVAGIAIAAGYAIGRTGCWAVGDDYGKPWDGPLAVAFPNGAPPSTVENMQNMFHVAVPAGLAPNFVLSVYPTQLMEVALGFMMFGILWRLRDHRHAAGWLFGLYGVLAGLERFVIEFYRAKDDRFLVSGLSTAQGMAIAITIAGALWMAWCWRTGPNQRGIRDTSGEVEHAGLSGAVPVGNELHV